MSTTTYKRDFHGSHIWLMSEDDFNKECLALYGCLPVFVKNDTKLLVFMETYGKIEGTDTRAYQREVEFPDGTHRKVYCLHHPTEIRMFEYLMILDADYEQIQRFIKIGRYIKYSWEK